MTIQRRLNMLRLHLLVAPAIVVFLFHGCLKRNNYWDPINSPLEKLEERGQKEKYLKSVDSIGRQFKQKLGNTREKLKDIDTSYYRGQREINKNIMGKNESTERENADKDSLNVLDCGNNWKRKDSLNFLAFVDSASTILADTSAEWAGRHSLDFFDSLTGAVQDTLAADNLLPDSLKNSVLDLLDTLRDSLEALIKVIDSMDSEFRRYNDTTVVPINEMIQEKLPAIGTYNDSLYAAFKALDCSKLTNQEEIQDAIDSIGPGDTIRIGEGVYDSVVLQFDTVAATANSKILIQGESPGKTIIKGSKVSPISLLKSKNIIFKNLVLQRGDSSSVKLTDSDSIWFENCDITGSSRYGIQLENSNINLSDCRVFEHTQSGLFISNTSASPAEIHLENVLFSNCNWAGVEGSVFGGTINHCTFTNNGEGLNLFTPVTKLTVKNSIFSTNQIGIRDRIGLFEEGNFSVTHCNFHGNNNDDAFFFSLPNPEDNYRIDPVFTKLNEKEFRIGNTSSLLLKIEPGQWIGYRHQP